MKKKFKLFDAPQEAGLEADEEVVEVTTDSEPQDAEPKMAGAEASEAHQEASEAVMESKPLVSKEDLAEAVEAILARREAERKAEEERRARLNSMSDEERRAFDLEERERALVEREEALREREHQGNALKLCSEHALPMAFAEVIARGSTEDDVEDIVKRLSSEWHASLAEATRAKARQEVPRSAQGTKSNSEEFSLSAMARNARKI